MTNNLLFRNFTSGNNNFTGLSIASKSSLDGFVKTSKKKRNQKILLVGLGLAVIGAAVGITIYFLKNTGETPIYVSVGSDPVELAAGGFYEIPFSALDNSFVLVRKNAEKNTVRPAARSYDGFAWEPVFPELLKMECRTKSCIVRLPAGNDTFEIQPNVAMDSKDDDQVSDFLALASFGPTRAMIRAFPKDGNFRDRVKSFIQEQLNTPYTSHRAYYRKRANPGLKANTQSGTVRTACEVGSRWSRYAFDSFDEHGNMTVSNGNLLYINGRLRTEVSPMFVSNLQKAGPSPWFLCKMDSRFATLGAATTFRSSWANSTCFYQNFLNHPEVRFTSERVQETLILHRNAEFTKMDPELDGVFILKTTYSDCISPVDTENVYAIDSFGTWYRYQPRIRLLQNTIDSPSKITYPSNPDWNPSPPKDFFNEKSCVPQAVSKAFSFKSTFVNLNVSSISKFYDLSKKFVYYVTGLQPTEGPCQSLGARFMRKAGLCNSPSAISSAAAQFLTSLIQSSDKGLIVTDILTSRDSSCSNLSPGIQLQISQDTCWVHVHSDLYSVFDFSDWVYQHPGGPDRIRSFARSGQFEFVFPRDVHAPSIWTQNVAKLRKIGVLGENINYISLPETLKVYESAKYFDALTVPTGLVYTEACGSFDEVANEPQRGHRFFFNHDGPATFDLLNYGFLDGYNYTQTNFNSKQYVWSNVVVKSQDQIRQRVAWALSEIFVVSVEGVESYGRHSEMWAKYYDIFVRNAFGNYFDVMKEVSYSPMMGTMLSYLGSVSYQRNVEYNRPGIYPDENYARELMQLFSIGLWKLHKNGTKEFDINGRVKETYNNLNIQSFARIWTGFKLRNPRGNTEVQYPANLIDPMFIAPEDHDTFPKEALDGAFIGDGFPLCITEPKRSFLRKGAKFRYLGSQNTPVMFSRYSSLELEVNSGLFRILCGASRPAECVFKSVVELANNLICYGKECELDSVRAVKLKLSETDLVYYEYIRLPCVHLEFPESGFLTSASDGSYPVCADKRELNAAPVCCGSSGSIGSEEVRYEGEITSYDTAVSRCKNVNKAVCSSFTSISLTSPLIGGQEAWRSYRFWKSESCSVKAQVFADGRIGVVHSNVAGRGSFVGLDMNSNVKLRVQWENMNYPKVSQNYCDEVCEIKGDSCLCPTVASTVALFTNSKEIPTVKQILETATIGAYDPSNQDSGVLSVFFSDPAQGLVIYVDQSKQFNANTVFQITLSGSRVRYFANLKTVVSIGSKYQFRNLPNFMQHDERTRRDAEAEVDALLNHLFSHPTAPVFISDFLIKRFTTSNPSPQYLQEVVNAFTSGKYEGIGSGRYGDLSATVSAVLLYREALSRTLKSDPFFGKAREPLLKVIHLLRSLEITLVKNKELDLANLAKLIGQEPYLAPSVFSFFQSEFQPAGLVSASSLYSPEAQLWTSPVMLSYVNSLLSLIEFGLTGCFDGLGNNLKWELGCEILKVSWFDPSYINAGSLNYSFLSNSKGSEIIDQLNTLLTGGRLDKTRKAVLLDMFYNISTSISASKAIKSVISAFTATPEFQVTQIVNQNTSAESTYLKKQMKYEGPENYKAVVYLFLEGGMDSYNLLVPHSECTGANLYDQYKQIRTQAAIPKQDLLVIENPSSAPTQPCKKFGITPQMPFLQQSYLSNEAAFISNIGTLVEPLTLAEFREGKKKQPIGLFAHNIQQKIAKNLVADSMNAKGVLGRVLDQLSRLNKSSAGYAVSGYFSSVLESENPSTAPQVIINPAQGIDLLDQHNLNPLLKDRIMNLTSGATRSIFGKTWNDMFKLSVDQSSELSELLKSASISPDFSRISHPLADQFAYVTRVISNRDALRSSVDVFNVQMFGFDTHNSLTDFGDNVKVLDDTLRVFVSEMKRLGVWDKVTVVVASDFARTLRSNGQGTDHAWGGNTFMMGGSVQGGQILGRYPLDLNDGKDVNVGNGVFIPTMPWEGMWNAVCEWIGFDAQTIDMILPYKKNFHKDLHLLGRNQVFVN